MSVSPMHIQRIRVASLFLLVAVLAVMLVLLVQSPARAQEMEEGQEAEETPEAEAPLVIPEEEKNRENPFKDDEEALQLGEKLFSTQCTMCHGPEGRGDGDLAADMELDMPDFTSPAMKEKTDGGLFYVLSEGHGSMPEQGDRMPEKNRWSLVSFIRTLGVDESAQE